MGILLDKLKDAVKEYEKRKSDIIYAHHLDDTVWVALEEKGIPPEMLENPYILIGELVHRGVDRVLQPSRPACRQVAVPASIVVRLDGRIVERWVKFDGEKHYVTVCGKSDAFVEIGGVAYPVELKTTRMNHDNGVPMKWIRRTETYAWLYRADEALLIVINLVSGDEYNLFVKRPERFEDRVINWLRGRYPYYSLIFS